jgi:ribonuclease J
MKDGESPSEAEIAATLAGMIAEAPHRVALTTFASNVGRVIAICRAAQKAGREVVMSGRSLHRIMGIAQELGMLEGLPTLHDQDAYRTLPRNKTVLICTGSQGEPMAALSRIARGEHNQVTIEPGDTVLYSSSTVPGNELAVNEIVNRLVRADAHFITERQNPKVHVSGHGSASDLLLMLELLRPDVFAPVHGEARHQRAHADLARAVGIDGERIHILDNGDVLEVTAEDASVADRVHAGLTYVDQAGGVDVTESVLRDRRHLSDDGLVLVIARIDASDGSLVGEPEVVTRGFGAGDDQQLIEETRLAVERSVAEHGDRRITEVGVLQHELHDTVAALVRKRTQQRPMVLPVIVEV